MKEVERFKKVFKKQHVLNFCHQINRIYSCLVRLIAIIKISCLLSIILGQQVGIKRKNNQQSKSARRVEK